MAVWDDYAHRMPKQLPRSSTSPARHIDIVPCYARERSLRALMVWVFTLVAHVAILACANAFSEPVPTASISWWGGKSVRAPSSSWWAINPVAISYVCYCLIFVQLCAIVFRTVSTSKLSHISMRASMLEIQGVGTVYWWYRQKIFIAPVADTVIWGFKFFTGNAVLPSYIWWEDYCYLSFLFALCMCVVHIGGKVHGTVSICMCFWGVAMGDWYMLLAGTMCFWVHRIVCFTSSQIDYPSRYLVVVPVMLLLSVGACYFTPRLPLSVSSTPGVDLPGALTWIVTYIKGYVTFNLTW